MYRVGMECFRDLNHGEATGKSTGNRSVGHVATSSMAWAWFTRIMLASTPICRRSRTHTTVAKWKAWWHPQAPAIGIAEHANRQGEGCIHHSLYLQLKANLPVVTAKLGGISIQHPS